MDPGGIQKDKLTSFDIFDAENAMTGRLGLWRDDGDLVAQDMVEKRRFPDIRPSKDGNKTGLKGSHLQSG